VHSAGETVPTREGTYVVVTVQLLPARIAITKLVNTYQLRSVTQIMIERQTNYAQVLKDKPLMAQRWGGAGTNWNTGVGGFVIVSHAVAVES